jgi:medium-chain acyl-[acyl-carrier-protein] hydrolase
MNLKLKMNMDLGMGQTMNLGPKPILNLNSKQNSKQSPKPKPEPERDRNQASLAAPRRSVRAGGWIVGTRRTDPAVRLFCLPPAGGGSSEYASWTEDFAEDIEVCPVELPGRQTRWREAPEDAVDALVEQLATAIAGELDRPYALFGHSMGSLLAFELIRTLRRRGQALPRVLFVSGGRAPHLRRTQDSIHDKSTEELTARLKAIGGLPDEVYQEKELLELLMPTIRADFALCETYRYREEPPLECPIVGLAGAEDEETPPAMMERWREQTAAGFALRVLPGGHFFLRPQRDAVLGVVRSALVACL